MKTYKKWTEEEWNTFYELLKTNTVIDAALIHAENTGRTVGTIMTMFCIRKKKGKVPSEVLDNILSSAWSNQEEKDLLKLIESHPNNFEEAYRIHAENTGRTVRAVKAHFCRYRKNEDAKVCMMTVGKRKKASPNRKNIYPGTGGNIEPVKQSKWRRILAILFE